MSEVSRYIRQESVINRDRIKGVTALVIGVGAIGHLTAKLLAQMGVGSLILFDFDEVGVENLAPQGFPDKAVGSKKVDFVAQECSELNPEVEINAYPVRYSIGWASNKRWKGDLVVFCCVDSISARKLIFEDIREYAKAFFDTRMAAETLVIISIDNPKEDSFYLEEAMFTDEQAYQGTCTSRSLAYASCTAAGHILGEFSKWLRDIPMERDYLFNMLALEISPFVEKPMVALEEAISGESAITV